MEHRNPRHAGEVYTIAQVEALTGVPANTIRSWERRHGFPHPERSGGNYRTYSQAEVDLISIVKQERDRGRTVEQAIAFARSPVQESAPAPVEPGRYVPARHEALVAALLETDLGAARQLMADAAWSSSLVDACFELLLPADLDLVRRDVTGKAPSFKVRIARHWIQRRLIAALESSDPESGSLLVAIAAVHDSSATTLALCHAINISRSGYRVLWVGDRVAVPDLTVMASEIRPAAIVLGGESEDATLAILSFAERWSGRVMVARRVPLGDPAVVDLPSTAMPALAAFDDAMRSTDGPRLVR